MQRIFTILAVLIVLLGIAAGVYFYFFSDQPGLLIEDGLPTENPFGGGGEEVPVPGIEDEIPPGETSVAVAPRLVKITDSPVAKGVAVLLATTTEVIATTGTTTPETTTTVEVRYIDRASGNMYAYRADDGRSTRLTNQTIPGAHEAAWLPDGSRAYLRFLSEGAPGEEHIETYLLPAEGEDGVFLARDLWTVAPVSLTRLFTFLPTTSGSSGTFVNADGSSPTALFSSPLSALSFSVSPTMFAAYTKPSSELPGYVFTVDAATGAFSRVLGPARGVSANIAPSGEQLLVSSIANGALQLSSYDIDERAITALPVQTLSEKCVWAPDSTTVYCAVPTALAGTLPDAWYRGTVSFTDRIWAIDFTSRIATLTVDLTELAEEPIDAVSLTLDPNGTTLVFVNKRDHSLWAYSL